MRDLGEYDYVIAGAGTAGCVLANRLSADADKRVLLLEAGGRDNYHWIHIPVGYLYCMGNPRTDWGFKTEAESGLGGRALAYPRGKVLGGCSSINGMIYMRGQARDYDHWRQLGNRGWGWDDVLPYFKKSEDQHAIEPDEFHAKGGEWRVENMRVNWEILDAFRDAAGEYGLPIVNDFNKGNNEGCGYFHVNQKSGVRWNTTKGFLNPVKHRPNLNIVTQAHVKKIRLDGTRVTGLDLTVDGKDAGVTCRGEVILSAGSVGSPQILQLSGIGPGEFLSGLGIEVRHDLSGVGANLQDHLQIRPVYRVRDTVTLNQRAGSVFGKLGIAVEYALFRSGPMSMAPSTLGCFAKSDPSRETPNLQFHVQALSLDSWDKPLHPFPAYTASVCNLRPESRGHVRIKSADPFAHPSIQPNYLSTPGDRKVAADAIRLAREISQQPALQKFGAEEYKPGIHLTSDDELADAAGQIGTTIFHPVGTCKMGNDPGAVVNDRLQVHGLSGLRVADASVMPTITSGNTNAPAIMIAEKAADMILEDARAKSAA